MFQGVKMHKSQQKISTLNFLSSALVNIFLKEIQKPCDTMSLFISLLFSTAYTHNNKTISFLFLKKLN